MLDVDLAAIYGYETKNFSRQVKNNADRFEGDEFMFQLTDAEVEELSRCKNFTLNRGTGRGSNVKYNPHAFTEQGVYLLMTVLRGGLAVKQSRALVMAFKAMKDYIIETQSLVTQRDLLRLSIQTTENTEAIRSMHTMLEDQQKLLATRAFCRAESGDELRESSAEFQVCWLMILGNFY
ncbi:MAG: ORF6N domain-containing protein [Lachnospiraceae bacterium]|nr:ORF6N domain-containing protein [Lachnospiraceae bacterium]